jgi:hypothetical protein
VVRRHSAERGGPAAVVHVDPIRACQVDIGLLQLSRLGGLLIRRVVVGVLRLAWPTTAKVEEIAFIADVRGERRVSDDVRLP